MENNILFQKNRTGNSTNFFLGSNLRLDWNLDFGGGLLIDFLGVDFLVVGSIFGWGLTGEGFGLAILVILAEAEELGGMYFHGKETSLSQYADIRFKISTYEGCETGSCSRDLSKQAKASTF